MLSMSHKLTMSLSLHCPYVDILIAQIWPLSIYKWFSVPSWRITRLPLSPETQELDCKRQFSPINTVISYRNIQGVTNGGYGWGVARGDMSHFIPKTQGIKADISGSVWRRRWVSAGANGQLDTFICSLWSRRGGLTEGSRTTAAGVRQLNGNVHVCKREREEGKKKKKARTGWDKRQNTTTRVRREETGASAAAGL